MPRLEQLCRELRHQGARQLAADLELNYVQGSLSAVYNRATNIDVALESDVTSWFTFRLGATKTMTKTTITIPTGEEYAFTYPIDVAAFLEGEGTVIELSDFTWHMGGGFHVGEWDIDAVFSHELPFRLGYWLTGYGNNLDEALVSRVSATYRF